MDLKAYQDLLIIAQRHSRVQHEAEDLLQDALLVAIEKERYDLTTPGNREWMVGVIRNLAKMTARSAVRRKTRHASLMGEQQVVEPPDTTGKINEKDEGEQSALLKELPSSSRIVAILLLHGLNKKEICSILDLADTAFRKRLSVLRRKLDPLPDALKQEALALAYASRQHRESSDDLSIGLIRKALLTHLNGPDDDGSARIGTHDPSGHLIVFKKDQK